jgi:Na+/glutamate symporter
MKHGRKFFAMIFGVCAVVVLALAALACGKDPNIGACTGAIGLMVGAFCGSNAWATPKTTTTTSESES